MDTSACQSQISQVVCTLHYHIIMTTTCMAIATGRTLDYVTLAMIASQTMQSWSPFSDFWEDQLPWQPLYVVCDVEYCDLLTMATRAVEWGSIILSQDALTKNGVISCIAGMPHLKQNFCDSKFQVRADYIVHLRICTRLSLFSLLQVMKNWEGGENEASMYTYITCCIICETHMTNVHMWSKRVCMGTFSELVA